MAQIFYAPKPGRFGTQPMISDKRLNTGVLAAGTLNLNQGASPIKSWVDRVAVCAQVWPSATSCTLQLFKMTGATAVALTAALDVNAKTADVPIQMVMLANVTDAQRTLGLGDSLRFAIVAVGAVAVQPVEWTGTISLLALE